MKLRTLLFGIALFTGFTTTSFAQNPSNGGFENGITSWTTSGTAQTTNARTGVNSLSHSTSSTSNVAHTNSTLISIPNGSYAHVIGWAIGSNTVARASCGGTLNVTTSSTAITTIGTTLTRLTHSVQNSSGSSQNFSCRVNTRSVAGPTIVYWDDVVMYSSTSATPDLVKPIEPTSFVVGTLNSSSASFSWTNGSDAGTGIQNTVILRTTNLSASAPSMNDQGIYSVTGGTSGPNIVSTDWTVLSTSVGSGSTSYTDSTVTQNTTYKYAVIHIDLAYNYSTALISGNIVIPASGITTQNDGDWDTGATWVGGNVPTSAQNAIVNHQVTVTNAVTRNLGTTTNVNAGASLTISNTFTNNGTTNVSGTIQMNTGGSIAGNSLTYNGTANTLIMNSSSGLFPISNTSGFWPTTNTPYNVTIQGTGAQINNALGAVAGTLILNQELNCAAANVLTVNGTLQINTNGFINTNAPIYGSASTLRYNSGFTYIRSFEWTSNVATIGVTPGYPNNVQISNNTAFSYYTAASTGPKGMNGNLTIDAGSSLTFGATTTAGALTVAGNVSNAGTLTLGSAVGDDLKTAGNFTNTGTFNGANRAIEFSKTSGTQTVSSTTVPLVIPYVVTSGATTVQFLNDVNITAPTAGTAVVLGAGTIIDLNNRNVIIGTAGVANIITGTGTFKGSTTSNLTLRGTGSIGTLYFTPTFQNLGTFTIDRTSGAVACVLGSALTVNTSLALTNGIVDVGNNPMTIGASGTISGASASNFVIADVANGTSASLRKTLSAAGTFTYPIGDSAASADGMQYSPLTVVFSGGTYGGYAGYAVHDIKQPNLDASTNYITRYWSMTSSGIAPTTYAVTGTYLPVDVVGTEAACQSNQWNGTSWTNGGAPVTTNTMSITCNTFPTTNHLTAGSRDREINVVQGVTNYLTGSTYDFGTVLTTTPVDVVFTIQNLGQQTITLTNTAPTMTGNPPYSVFANYSGTTVPIISGTTPGTRTFTIRFAPTANGTFTGSATIVNDDANESSYVINFTGVGQVPAPDINVKGVVGANPSILSGDSTPAASDNTQFANTNLGASTVNTFRIENIGNLALNVTSITSSNPTEFTVTSSAPYSNIPFSGTNYVDFTITFSPQLAGLRTGTITIVHDDPYGSESPYTFAVEGNGVCATATNTVTPTSGPVGTEVTITATANNLSGAGLTLNGVTVTPITQVSATQIKFTVPSGATSGNLVTTNSQGCTATNAFTVLTTLAQPCEGGYIPTDLFISEFTDSNAGALSYVEIYNGTGVTKNLANYSIRVANNGGAYAAPLALSNVNLASGSTYVVALGDDDACGTPGGNGSYGAQSFIGGSVNFTNNEHDHAALFNGSTQIDSWGAFGNNTWANGLGLGTEGANFKRRTTVVAPNTTYLNADWIITDYAGAGVGSCANNDYSNIGIYSMPAVTTPTVTTHPTYTPTCKATSLTVAGTEGFSGGNALAYQWYAVAPNATTWTALTDGGLYSGTNTATLNIADVATLVGYQFYCQVRENSATCYAASNAVMITAGQSTTWNGSAWSNGAPTTGMAVVINGNYDTALHGSFEACSVTVNGGFTLNIQSGDYVSIVNDLTVNTAATFLVQDDASLVMVNDNGVVTNNGTTNVIRTTAPFELYDYTYWSSPVNGANISSTFTGWRTDYSFEFNAANYSDMNTIDYYGTVTAAGVPDSFDDYAPWAWLPYTGNMTNGKGYAIMGPTGLAFGPSATTTVTFSGPVNNGVISIGIVESGNPANTADDFNLIGNPYPSAIFADDFITTNGAKTSGSLYFWTHVDDVSISNPGPNLYNFITDDYAVYNLSGSTRASFTGSAVPTGYIASGQGFFVEAQGNNTLTFNNAMRDKDHDNTQFFRTAQTQAAEKDRLWLNLRNGDGMFGQLLVAYLPDSTLDFDWAYDARVNQSNNYLSFYTLGNNEKYKIQARSNFVASDIVPIGYFSSVDGEFSISIDQQEGVLNSESTNIYVEDLQLNIIHDLKASPYTFTTASGKFENRFLLRYTNGSALDNPNFDTLNNSVVVAANQGALTIKSYIQTIDEVMVYDVLGRQLYQAKGIGTNDFTTSNISLSQQSLIVKIKLDSGTVVTKKILMN
ncbi:choice-of-anchor D domain-containing protein [Flavobacterium sp. J49]|nr:choice-of-anchor D domain-containing protein [Flavobacterium sp. J49]NIC02895.1 choice-of-anchor D domain-containing protein [Flavobacterium sp. J49]